MCFRVRVVFVCMAFGLLSGCALGITIGEARNVTASGSTFSTELYHGYLDLAEMEYSEGDYSDSDFFSRQAIEAAANHAPEPRLFRDRSMPASFAGEVVASRARLMRVFNKGARVRWPSEAARAQVMFDCWMQEQEENFQTTHINLCRRAFMVAIQRLEGALGPPVIAEAGPGEQVAALGAGSGTAAARYIVYFAFDQSDISPTAKRVIQNALAQAEKLGAKRIDLLGHADRAGETPYNQNLSMERARAVAAIMKSAGTDESTISLGGMGENLPAVPTPDGVRDHRNRRVEIKLAE